VLDVAAAIRFREHEPRRERADDERGADQVREVREREREHE
jgi:hypothetical protein